nr:aminopeptidase P family protein [Eubacterium sp.]
MIQDVLKENGLDGVIISSPANMRSQSGFRGEGIVYISETMRVVFTDSRYTIAAKEECPEFEIVQYKGSLYETWLTLLLERLGSSVVAALNVGYEDSEMTVQSYHKLEDVLRKHEVPGVTLKPLGNALDLLRQQKTEEEIRWMERAEQIGDQAFGKILATIREYREMEKSLTEKQVAAYLEFYMKELGAEGTSFDTIAASGIHSSMPHAIPTDKVLEDGDFLTMDFGCKVNGYCSDMTRTIVIGSANEKQKEIYEVVRQAQQAALDAIRPGMKGREVDEIARAVIRDAGYGDCFGHSLGHSVGLMIHETPCFAPREDSEIKPGMVITVEPGIYVEGFGGVRIEDVVVITEDGCQNLTHSEKALIEIK